MQIDLLSDRARRRPDPVEAVDGVFAALAKEEMSRAEVLRLARAIHKEGAAATQNEVSLERAPELAPKEWSSKAILKRLTDLYAKFKKPGGKA